MGWSWGLWVCHETLVDVMQAAAGPEDEFSLAGGVSATARAENVVHAPYVDNATVVGLSRDAVARSMDRIKAELDRRFSSVARVQRSLL